MNHSWIAWLLMFLIIPALSQVNPALVGLADNTWQKMTPAFSPAGLPFHGFDHPKCESRLVFTEKESVVVWFAGCSNGYTNSTWLYSVTRNQWTQANGLTYLQGGVEKEGPMTSAIVKECTSLPHGQCHYSITYDSDSGVCLKHTGIESGWTVPDQNTWGYDAGLKKWTKFVSFGSGNTSIQALAYDRDNHKTILFGSYSGYAGADGNTTYAFDMTTKAWTNRKPLAPPSGRGWAAFAYHQRIKKCVLFSGSAYYGPVKNDTWLYDYSANSWQQIFPSNPPAPRTRASMAYDSENGVMVLFGGNDTCYGAGSGAGRQLTDTWVLDVENNRWIEMTPAVHPSNTKTWQGAYDPANNVMVVMDLNSDTWVYRYKKSGLAAEGRKLRAASSGLEISPQPVVAHAVLTVRGAEEWNRLGVYDVAGKKVMDLSAKRGSAEVVWNAASLAPGLYTIKLKSGAQTLLKRVIVAR